MNTKSDTFRFIGGLSFFALVIAVVFAFISELIIPNFWNIINWMANHFWLTILILSFVWFVVMCILEAIYGKR